MTTKKLPKNPPRAKEGGPRWKGDGHDQARMNRAHAKRRRRAERNQRNQERSR